MFRPEYARSAPETKKLKSSTAGKHDPRLSKRAGCEKLSPVREAMCRIDNEHMRRPRPPFFMSGSAEILANTFPLNQAPKEEDGTAENAG